VNASGTATIRNRLGFHVRPTTRFIEEVKKHQSAVRVTANGQTVEAASPMGLLTLGCAQGDVVRVDCEGDDAEEACQALLSLIESSFGGIE
jgi:phosphotransferase system HPr (HPr) family protein